MDLSKVTHATQSQIDDVMNYHNWDDDKIKTGVKIREAIGNALLVVLNNVPPCGDRDSAIRKLREARMDCNSALTFNGEY